MPGALRTAGAVVHPGPGAGGPLFSRKEQPMSLRIVLLLALGLVLGCARPQGRPPTSAAVPDTQALRQLTVPQPQTAVETLQTLLETQGARVQRPDDRSIPI